MTKTPKTSSGKRRAKGTAADAKAPRRAETGRTVAVAGLGALKDSGLKIRSDISLLKPIAQQVFARLSGGHEAG